MLACIPFLHNEPANGVCSGTAHFQCAKATGERVRVQTPVGYSVCSCSETVHSECYEAAGERVRVQTSVGYALDATYII
jgi:hypothetical protein